MKLRPFILACGTMANAIAYSTPFDTHYSGSKSSDNEWGIATFWRSASVPYETEGEDQSVHSFFIPALYYRNNHFYLDGTRAGVHLYKGNSASLDLMGQVRFIDLPKSQQNLSGQDTTDFGIRFTNHIFEDTKLDASLMATHDRNLYGKLSLGWHYSLAGVSLTPDLEMRYKSSGFNTEHFSRIYPGLRLDSGIDFSASLESSYPLTRELHLMGKATLSYLDSSVTRSPYINDATQTEFYLGLGYFPDSPAGAGSLPGYLRLAHGWATPSDISEIVSLESEPDTHDNSLTSLFYGYPVTENLYGYPLDIFFTAGYVRHHASSVQSATGEYVAGLKGYWTFNWPLSWRLGVAQGISYLEEITYIEGSEMESKGYKPSHAMNYLDFSLDANLGELLSTEKLNSFWIGYSLHHRSAIFESSSLYGRIKGGSNYNSLYLQYDFR